MPIHLALDVGAETIGLAVCDADERQVRALHTVHRVRRKRDIAAVAAVAAVQGAEVIVVGLPRLKSGDEGDSARRARAIGELVAAATGLPVVYHDEHLSTFEATERLQARGYHGAELAARVDAEAARVILEDYLTPGSGL